MARGPAFKADMKTYGLGLGGYNSTWHISFLIVSVATTSEFICLLCSFPAWPGPNGQAAPVCCCRPILLGKADSIMSVIEFQCPYV